MQELWLLKQQWDEELPPSYALQWQKYRSELELVHECSLPRAVVPVHASADRVELYGFADASCRAYGAAIYVRVIDKHGGISANLLAAKSKVAPVRVVSLPRLELEGARLLAQLMEKIKRCAPESLSKVGYFTDSTIVLSWIASHASRWTTFVANRVAIIQELSNAQEWYKIESKQNPADIVCRGLYTSQLKASSLWWQGPEFLQLPDEQRTLGEWQGPEGLPEQRNNKFSLLACPKIIIDDILGGSKYAKDFLKLTRVFGFIYRWRQIAQKIDSTRAKELTALELKGGLNYVVFNLQALGFYTEIEKLRNGKIISSSKIQALNPFLDQSEGIEIIRVGGRLSRANVPFDTKHPMLLPNNHIVVKSLFEYTHRSNMHVGAQALCAFVRQRFWVINARKLARSTAECSKE
ncbi:uncharacterized protein LOC117902179 isoform X1 [Drosophila subobscura]|uniref:uncharacterized protein LOC117902179 isoform X1 n=1 Tax=Drosophila subobscura TaxID=7241 RepID=UPI00155A8ADF|nr:uncharacterized protein LOC117902179 isoform X1 [Drosophila subobscura]